MIVYDTLKSLKQILQQTKRADLYYVLEAPPPPSPPP